jgi:hypothetical protein
VIFFTCIIKLNAFGACAIKLFTKGSPFDVGKPYQQILGLDVNVPNTLA